jgi:hypothetical protein
VDGDSGDTADVRLELTTPEAVRDAWSGPSGHDVADLRLDGLRFRTQRGTADDLLLEYGDRAAFHVSAPHDTVLCGPVNADDAAWRRVLLDTVLWLAALWHGGEALHAAGVRTAGGVVALVGATGGGKTTLAAELIRRGAQFFTDDVLFLDGRERAHPGPALMNVPLGGAIAPSELGDEVARIGDEAWVEVRDAASAPAPLAALVLVARDPELSTRLERISPGLHDLRPRLFAHPFAPDRERARFELCAELAQRVPTARLEADLAATPAELAELVEGFVA